jgi:hypothetical protein
MDQRTLDNEDGEKPVANVVYNHLCRGSGYCSDSGNDILPADIVFKDPPVKLSGDGSYNDCIGSSKAMETIVFEHSFSASCSNHHYLPVSTGNFGGGVSVDRHGGGSHDNRGADGNMANSLYGLGEVFGQACLCGGGDHHANHSGTEI